MKITFECGKPDDRQSAEREWPLVPRIEEYVELDDGRVRGHVFTVLWTDDGVVVRLR